MSEIPTLLASLAPKRRTSSSSSTSSTSDTPAPAQTQAQTQASRRWSLSALAAMARPKTDEDLAASVNQGHPHHPHHDPHTSTVGWIDGVPSIPARVYLYGLPNPVDEQEMHGPHPMPTASAAAAGKKHEDKGYPTGVWSETVPVPEWKGAGLRRQYSNNSESAIKEEPYPTGVWSEVPPVTGWRVHKRP